MVSSAPPIRAAAAASRRGIRQISHRVRLYAPSLEAGLNAQNKIDDGANAKLFRETFLRALLTKLPSWEAYIAKSARTNSPIEVRPRGWNGPSFRIYVRDGDTVTVYPLCDFGLDYISTANDEDLKQRPDLVFERVLSDVTEFVGGRKVIAIKRHKWLFIKLGWDVRFIQTSETKDSIRAAASIIAWPTAK
jgi:hypothetical protein